MLDPWFVLVFGVLIILVVGCGSGNGAEGERTASLTKKQFIARSGEICERHYQKIDAEYTAFEKESSPGSTASSGELTETILVPVIANMSKELRALGAPAGDADRISAMLDALDRGVETAEENPETLDPFGPGLLKAKQYGLVICGNG